MPENMDRRSFLKMFSKATAGTVALGLEGWLNKAEAKAFNAPPAFLDHLSEHSIKFENKSEIEKEFVKWLVKRPEFKERAKFATSEYLEKEIEKYQKSYEFFKNKELELDNNERSDENLLARAMLSEEDREEANLLIAAIIGQSVINRVKNAKERNARGYNYENVILGFDNENFGSQDKTRPYASQTDPFSHSQGKKYRILAKMMLEGNLTRSVDFGQTHFLHSATQDYLQELYPHNYYSADKKDKQWQSMGIQRVIMPSVNDDYIRFYVENGDGDYATTDKNLGGNRNFVVPVPQKAGEVKKFGKKVV